VKSERRISVKGEIKPKLSVHRRIFICLPTLSVSIVELNSFPPDYKLPKLNAVGYSLTNHVLQIV
jgi:hypothetical protein